MSDTPDRQLAAMVRVGALVLGGLCFTISVQAASPSLTRIAPRGGQRGTELDLTFSGARLADAAEIMFYETGIQVLKLEAGNKSRVKVRAKIAPDCALGEHKLRVRTRSGISEMRTFFVGPFPSVAEQEPNSDFNAPQRITMNCTVAGVVQNEDVDYFLVEAHEGQRITAEIEATRLGMTLFDPYVAILDRRRFELAASDDTALLLQDAVASTIAPADGTYVIQVRETSYGGNGNCMYRLHVGEFPRPTGVFPPGGKAGEKITFTLLGDPTGTSTQQVQLPGSAQPKFGLFAQQGTHQSPSPNWIRVSDFANVTESEPNNDFKTATAAAAPLPLAFNGIIGRDNDVDCFKFKAKQGQQFDVRVHARSVRSPLDSVLNLFYASGKSVAGNDDSGGPDSYLRFRVPADGEYVVRVTDHLRKGGIDYTYRIEFEPVKPRLSVRVPVFVRFRQTRQNVPVPRGNRFATVFQASRANFGGELRFEVPELPAGITLHAPVMAANQSVVPVVFEAKAGTPLGGKLVDVIGRHVDPKTSISGGFHLPIDLVLGPPNNTTYYRTSVDQLAVAVTEATPFKIQLVEPKVPLVQDGSMQLKVVAERQEGFKAPITLRMLYNPPGVGSSSSITIPEGKHEAYYPVNANSRAQVRKWPIVILGNATVNGGPVYASSQLATLEVAAPFVAAQMQMAATEQGQPVELVCKLDQKVPFEGKAKVKLVGLPHKVTAVETEITRESKEVIFPLTVAKDSRPGTHKGLFCQLIVTQNGEPILHNTARGGVLRIDPPPPPKKNEPLKPAPKQVAKKPAPPAKKPARRLTRLEKLRLEQTERAQLGRGDSQ